MKKILLLLGVFLLLTGCTANYNIKINEDLTVDEEAYLYGDEDLFNTYYKTSKINVLKELLGNFESVLKEKKYQYEVSDDEYVLVKNKYNNIQNCIDNSVLFNDYFDSINYSKNDNLIKLETEGFNPNSTDDPERFYVKKLDISITPAYKVTNSNASKIDEKTNTYHFIMDENTDDFKILLEIDTSKKFNPLEKEIIMIIVAVLIAIISWVVVFALNKKKKYN